MDSNFETTYNSTTSEYEYTVKSTLAADWNTSAFYLTGVASKSSAQNVTAPTLTVTWSFADPAATPTTYAVTFNTNGGSEVDAQTVNAGGKATAPQSNPTKASDDNYTYEFEGWYADENLNTEFDFENTVINQATVIYAKWSATEKVTEVAPSIETKSYTYDQSEDLEITVNLGAGSKAAVNGVSKVYRYASDTSSETTELANSSKWSYANGKLTFKKGQFGSNTTGDKRYIKVVFDDEEETAVNVELVIK